MYINLCANYKESTHLMHFGIKVTLLKCNILVFVNFSFIADRGCKPEPCEE